MWGPYSDNELRMDTIRLIPQILFTLIHARPESRLATRFDLVTVIKPHFLQILRQ